MSSIESRNRFRSKGSSKCFVKGSMRGKASDRTSSDRTSSDRTSSDRTSSADLDELARLHDGRQTPAILSEHANVLERVSVDDQDIRAAARLDLTEIDRKS